ncbi:sensor histidine kinase [Sporolactobacillus inulinus]|uniref:Sensor histidine kinase n=1 Tax=Sporolactobacillus inulinus CASD TaxID=1069536 RepID=A0A0U1QLR0_9BACL|nr:sensor histidine kinase [Sporolactobacillus inulinus]KLI01566.1 histidine kinase [Sporolactobacillus inulinus CASD]GEB78143.1 sensor histidine kinase [Sporolactobacillus inulinus]
MNVVQRQIVTGTCFAFVCLILFGALFLFAFPLPNWSLLWSRQIWHLPFLFIVPILSLFAGGIAGLLSGMYWRRQLAMIRDAMDQVSQGGHAAASFSARSAEIEPIMNRVKQLSTKMSALTKAAQQTVSDKAEIEEKAIQKIVSEERNRLARELHDSVSQQLFAASMLMSTINELRPNTDDPEGKQLKLVEQTIHQSQLEMRALFLHLRPVQLHGKALKQGMEELLLELKQKVPMTINASIEPVSLKRGIEDQLFRILQETVSNTLRHAKAHSLDVLLIKREGFVILRVTDDGIGFDAKKTKPGSYGLQNINERSAQIGAQIKLVSVPDKGTSLEIKVPLLERDENND